MNSFKLNGTVEFVGDTSSAPEQSRTLWTVLWDDYLSKKYFNMEILYYSFVVFGPIISISLLIRFYILSRRKRVHLSPQLKVHLIAWICSSTLGLLFFSTIFWKKFTPPSIQITNLISELIRGSLHISSTNTIPMSTTFLLIDRIISISFVGGRLFTWRQNIRWISIVALSIIFFGNLSVLFWRTLISPVNAMEGCTFSCRTNTTIKDLLSVKLVISVLNIICGAIFVYLYLRYAKSLKFRRERKLNHTILLVFLTELCCNITPTGIYLVFSENIFFHSIQLSSMISIGHNVDGLCTGVLYWYTRSNTSVVSKIIPLPKPQTSTSTASNFKTLSSHSIQRQPIFTLGSKNTPTRRAALMRQATIEQNLSSQKRMSISTPGILQSKMKPPGTA